MSCLLISVHFHDARYHGRPDWPPSPARLFQALVAGAAQSETLTKEDRRALAWLESLGPPVIAAPLARLGQSLKNFVPNNDLDAVGGDPGRVGEIRTSKLTRPILFDKASPLLYFWTYTDTAEAEVEALQICTIAGQLYQLGRGVDMAWAQSEILASEEAETRLMVAGCVYRPSSGVGNAMLAVPSPGSLASLVERHKKMRTRFHTLYEPRPTRREPDRILATGQTFVQPPKPRFRQVAYASPPVCLLFDLVGARAPWRLDRIVELLTLVRDAAAKRLKDKLRDKANEIDNVIVGRCASTEADKAARIRITPLPSIGHQHADHAIRRILIEIPPNCPLRADDLEWAFSGLEAIESQSDSSTEEIHDQLILALAPDRSLLHHYGIEDTLSRVWRTVTPAALPQQAMRRRIEPARKSEEAKGGVEREKEESKAIMAVIQSLRHAGLRTRPVAVSVQREPFEAKGARAEAFAPGTRFTKERLWHAEITFAEPMRGPLVLGDGRYLGLGLMMPVVDAWRDVIVFSLPADARIATADRHELLHAVRRALMSLSSDNDGRIARLFSGHESDGGPAASGRHEHIFLATDDTNQDGRIDRIIVAAPWICDRSEWARRDLRATFDDVVSSLTTVRAGRLGVIALAQFPLGDDDPLVRPARIWESRTPYHATRHAGRRKDPAAALVSDVLGECARRHLPRPQVKLIGFSAPPNGGSLSARLRLHFTAAVRGPILLGRDSHRGGGLFSAVDE